MVDVKNTKKPSVSHVLNGFRLWFLVFFLCRTAVSNTPSPGSCSHSVATAPSCSRELAEAWGLFLSPLLAAGPQGVGMNGPRDAPVVPASHGHNQSLAACSCCSCGGLMGSNITGGVWDPPGTKRPSPQAAVDGQATAETFPIETRDCKCGFAAAVPFAACPPCY